MESGGLQLLLGLIGAPSATPPAVVDEGESSNAGGGGGVGTSSTGTGARTTGTATTAAASQLTLDFLIAQVGFLGSLAPHLRRGTVDEAGIQAALID